MHKARITVIVAAIALASCGGGGGSNDQGVSFRALGVFQETLEQQAPAADTLPTPELAVGDTGRTIILSQTQVFPTDVNRDGDLDGGFLGFQNLLASQRLNVTGAHVELLVPGALINPVATDFVPIALTLGPAVVGLNEEAQNVAYAQTLFVSPDVLAFLNQNPSLLPTPPYQINVVMTATAVSDGGETYESNEFTYAITVLPEPR